MPEKKFFSALGGGGAPTATPLATPMSVTVTDEMSLDEAAASQGRINHRAGCTMGGPSLPAARGPPINSQMFTTLF